MAAPPATNPSSLDEKVHVVSSSETDTGTESDVESEAESVASDTKTTRDTSPRSHSRSTEQEQERDPRFHQPPPSRLKRLALIVFTLLLFGVALRMRQSLWREKKAPKVIYASRYSREHKFRPAASPIITETLKDGRIRIRGAGPTATPDPKPTPSKSKTKKGRRKTKRSSAKKVNKKPAVRK
ncbi:hypothetical protein DXG03_002671 [Asterophora parasitica]|uniref:Uncharacterized protein n=1 Tax=Asterophora parasitica TaxID=117018 RepID=A0A9P7KGB8_9AGAR|nr:hypothetical protein DXG03_002671 [Asterophora parasitica]